VTFTVAAIDEYEVKSPEMRIRWARASSASLLLAVCLCVNDLNALSLDFFHLKGEDVIMKTE
jgi:hypothetical protein